MAWLQQLHDFNRKLGSDTDSGSDGAAGAALAQALLNLRRSARPGSAIVLISDFDGADDPRVREQLHRLAQHNALVGVHVFDPLERELPPPARYAITDGHARLTLDSGDRALCDRHRAHFDAHRAQVRELFGGLGANLIDVATDVPPLAALTAGLRS